MEIARTIKDNYELSLLIKTIVSEKINGDNIYEIFSTEKKTNPIEKCSIVANTIVGNVPFSINAVSLMDDKSDEKMPHMLVERLFSRSQIKNEYHYTNGYFEDYAYIQHKKLANDEHIFKLAAMQITINAKFKDIKDVKTRKIYYNKELLSELELL